ncbi:NAD(P)-dependent oxidoreductase [Exilibacterium tricleocarpae]|uniref:NAD(P)-dependent oxidoreductase n=1 Tax=Exilibacterium tricleocarpae TaxID=2591008 RepID=A0A545T667_9GAMM|nr:NAD(P)-dependent oxidoreductase [Exilibacterium tricleocarpae]TQV72721.1 NAD(P)-dependent oxidoreductase [Exilibacterium tricleocarpae]
MPDVALFGLGEAGALIGADLVAAGVGVRAYDPAAVPTPPGVERMAEARQAVAGAGVILALTAGADAPAALQQALADIAPGTLYADFSTNAAATKAEMGRTAAARQLDFVDVALMAVVPGKGLRTPTLASGPGARRWAHLFMPLGMPVQIVSAVPGEAATRKLLRSVMMKGLAAVVIEAMRAGEAAGCADWLWENLSAEVTAADELLLSRLVAGTAPHAARRLHEMQCVSALLEELGVAPVMTDATVESLRQVPGQGLPAIPGAG